jgi:hypothetical protein
LELKWNILKWTEESSSWLKPKQIYKFWVCSKSKAPLNLNPRVDWIRWHAYSIFPVLGISLQDKMTTWINNHVVLCRINHWTSRWKNKMTGNWWIKITIYAWLSDKRKLEYPPRKDTPWQRKKSGFKLLSSASSSIGIAARQLHLSLTPAVYKCTCRRTWTENGRAGKRETGNWQKQC